MTRNKITIKNEKEIDIMREGGDVLSRVLKILSERAQIGTSTLELDQLAEKLIKEAGMEPAFKNYQGFPNTLCASINEEIIHGIPKADRLLQDGDIIGLDLGLRHKGFYLDSAVTVGVGRLVPSARKIIQTARGALLYGCSLIKPGLKLGDLGVAIDEFIRKQGFWAVREYCGHGIGKDLHEAPEILNFGEPGTGLELKEGMTLAIEPMVNEFDPWTKTAPDGWTAVTKKGGLSSHFEATVAVTREGCEILTKV